MEKRSLDITECKTAKENISDIKLHGNVDAFVLFSKASSEAQGFMKSTKVMNVPGGCVMQVTSQQRNPDGSFALAEALTFIPNANINRDASPRFLERI